MDTPARVDAVIASNVDAGFTFHPGDLLRADAQSNLDLIDDELEKVGGVFASKSLLSGSLGIVAE
jgi:hypothetical protein